MKKRREKEASQPVRERSESEKHYEMDVFPADEGDGGYDEALAVEETDNDGDGGDVCRICRSSEKPDDPLRYVCACRGSNYFHEECLRLCLDRHGNKQCEIRDPKSTKYMFGLQKSTFRLASTQVCRCSYSFVPVYSEKAPERLPCRDSLRGLSLRSVRVAAYDFPADDGDGGYDEALAAEGTDNDGDGGDVCRICRSSEKPDDPLRYVCACRGSNYFHEECLRLCLDRHGNKQCEIRDPKSTKYMFGLQKSTFRLASTQVCRCSYSFVPVYSEKAPERLPCRDSLRGLSLRSVRVAAFPTVGTDEEHDALEDTEAANTLMAKINETVKILSKSKVTNLEKARNDYIEELKADLASLYGFNEFLTGYLVETDKKTLSDQLRERRFILKNFKHMEGVIEVYQDNREGYRPETSIVNTPEHENGYYTVQNASLFLPVLALNPLEEDIVMDMNADSGTNTAYIAARTRNTGDIHANQIGTGTVSPCPKNKRKRSRKLVKYLQGMGVNTSSVSVSQDNEIELRNRIHNSMNLVLLHAPSSQSGIVEKMMQDELLIDVGQVEKCVRLQKKLILRAIDLAKGDSGFIVYSTDSILVEEVGALGLFNEAIIDYALKKRSNVQLVHCNLDFGKNG
ncbi:hypothetical protein YC2023_007578 [Brassica napus]